MKREFLDYVDDVADAMRKTQGFTGGMNYEEFSKDEKTVFAVIRAIEVIGEAAKKIPLSVRKRYPDVPSLMPGNFGELLTVKQVADLIAFLQQSAGVLPSE